MPALIGNDIDGQIEPTPDGFRVIECGRPFSRAIAAGYLTKARLLGTLSGGDGLVGLIARSILTEFPLPDSALGR